MKVISIINCRECPNYDHKGAFGNVSYIPICRLTNREPKWEAVLNSMNNYQACQIEDIPDWCPLEDI